MSIFPKCKTEENFAIGITYDGYVAPCCVMTGTNFQQIKNLLGDKIEQLHISSGSLDVINNSEAALIIEQSFNTNPMTTCKHVCGSPIKHNETPASGDSKRFIITRDM
jgi:hypothetical protein